MKLTRLLNNFKRYSLRISYVQDFKLFLQSVKWNEVKLSDIYVALIMVF